MPALIPGWRCLIDALIRAYGEEGPVDVVALHADHGVALIGFLAEGEQASPGEASEALRAMLCDEGFERRFAGELPIVALSLPRAARSQLVTAVDRAFAGMPAPTVPPGWIDWLVERLRPAAPSAEPTPLLTAPRRNEPSPEEPATEIALTAPERGESLPEKAEGNALLAPAEAPPRSEPERRPDWLEWGTVLGFAFGIAAALVAGLATVFRNGRLF
ncbi:MAG TPA: hypothetical protein VF502_05140 [Stellaceae bacterium]